MAATTSTEDDKQRTTNIEDHCEDQLHTSPEHGFNNIPPNYALRSSNEADQSPSSASTSRKHRLPIELWLDMANFLHAIDVLNLALTCTDVFTIFKNDFKSLRERLEPSPYVTSKTDSTKKEGRKLPLWALSLLLEKHRVADNHGGRACIRRRQADHYEKNISACFEIVENDDPDEKKREELKRTAPQVLLLFLEVALQEYPFDSRERLFIKTCIDKKLFRKVPWDDLLRDALRQTVRSLAFVEQRIQCRRCPEVQFFINQGADPSILDDFISRLAMQYNERERWRKRRAAAVGQAQRARGNGARRLPSFTPR